MGTERINLVADDIGGTQLRFAGAKYFYGNGAVGKIIGVKPTTDEDTAKNKLKLKTTDYKKYLVRLVAICAGNIAGIGNQSQRDKKFNITFYCHPDRADNAMLELPGKSVDRGAGAGRLTIQSVHRPRRVTYL
ncbi:MAG: hypothetical protein DCF17_21240 [Shackletoniella antarctica]|uniref:Uncharacterized protein n=1 Tax=Shackletoniella antarctica TaxID=268115 RepID=A0A2W4VN96_9CYAN|nr:MAG: hypothetical protein DCF17_21240 [Shackletoniella antarctica]